MDSIAAAAGVNSATIWRWSNSTNGPTLSKLAEVGDALGLTMSELGAAFDQARGGATDGEDDAPHRPWPTFHQIITHASDLTEDEASLLSQTLSAVRAAKSGATTVIVR